MVPALLRAVTVAAARACSEAGLAADFDCLSVRSGSPPPTSTKEPGFAVTTRVVKRLPAPITSNAATAVSTFSEDAGTSALSPRLSRVPPLTGSTTTRPQTPMPVREIWSRRAFSLSGSGSGAALGVGVAVGTAADGWTVVVADGVSAAGPEQPHTASSDAATTPATSPRARRGHDWGTRDSFSDRLGR